MTDVSGETTELLQQLIRNACVNDGTTESGGEQRSVETLVSYLEGSGLDFETYEPMPGRGNLVARIDGSDPEAPALLLMGHLDVVPANPDRWQRDPFGGELVDGIVWGRGAVDMLDTTASMAVAFKQLARENFRPRGSLIYFACADEEALGTWGAKWVTENQADVVRADYVITEFGGMRFPFESGSGPKLPVMAAEKGTYWCKLRVRGTPAHGSFGSFRTDNALVKAAEIARRIAAFRPPARLHETWQRFVRGMDLPPELSGALLDEAKLEVLCDELPLGAGRLFNACTHTTMAPTIMHAGVKTNIIPDTAEIQVDVRTLPGERVDETRALLREAIGDLWDEVEVVEDSPFESSASPTDTPLWETLQKVTASLIPGAECVPFMIIGATDARYFRKLGIPAYGYGLLSERIPFDEFERMFHSDDERVDVESLRLMTELWQGTARDLLA